MQQVCLRSNPEVQERCQDVPPDPIVLENETGKRWHDMVKAGDGYNAFIEWLRADNMNGNNRNGDGVGVAPLAGIEAP